ncbi:effector-associated domain EAD1-containing protein [Frankia sp. CiP1_Cm_nod1]|uniref:effector-associated domain EAD1-containing protein n=1 Tax=Frankia sp. CiP1_Cm_nod1 TaxID=2897160 RepID=UPI00202599BB
MAPVAGGDVGMVAGDDPDIRLSRDDRDDFRDELAAVYTTEGAASIVLSQIDFPLAYRPVLLGGNPEQWWSQIFVELSAGTVEGTPYRRLLRTARRRFPGNPVFRRLDVAYLGSQQHVGAGELNGAVSEPPAGSTGSAGSTESAARSTGADEEAGAAEGPAAEEGPMAEEEPAVEEGPAQSCHVIVQAGSETERRHAREILTGLGLRPHEFWSTRHAISYRVGSIDTEAVRERLDGTDLWWTVVSPGAPDYVLRTLYVGGPDGRQFRLRDTPAQQTVSDVATSVMDEYPPAFTDATRSVVVDKVAPDGSRERLNADDTLHDAGIRDSSRMQIGVEARAGALNPKDRQEALHRVRNQIVAYARAHPGFQVRANSSLLPTEYELEFVQPSFGPGAAPGDDPITVDRHVVLIQLGAEFPETPPLVFWLTPVFHPNVFPNYDCDQAREHEAQQGLVCLGALAESYRPSLDFGELCQILVDMAAFRNYSLLEDSGRLDAFGRPEVRGNYYDRAAAEWVVTNQGRIAEIGGRVLSQTPRQRATYRNVVESVEANGDDPQAGAGAGADGR